MTPETFEVSIHPSKGLRSKLRTGLRSAVLSALGTLCPLGRSGSDLRFLMGHYVFDDQRMAFEQQITMLRNLGEFVSTQEALTMLKGETPMDGRYFHLSFDDGLDCLARNALPVLKAAGIPALVFVNSAVVGTPSAREREAWEKATNYAQPLAVMDWQTLAESGFEIGAHTRTHRRLSKISHDAEHLEHEVVGCKTEIEAALGQRCRYFAWPFGQMADVDARSLSLIRSTFDAAFGAFRAPVKFGATDPFMIPRHQMEPHWPLSHIRYFALGGGERLEWTR